MIEPQPQSAQTFIKHVFTGIICNIARETTIAYIKPLKTYFSTVGEFVVV